jgi:hypothetical protein
MHVASQAHSAAEQAAGPSADGAPLVDGAARDALRQAMRQLSDAESRTGPSQAATLCHALTEAARALAGLHAYGPAESYLAQALRWAAVLGSPDLRADLQCALAEVATNAADLAQALGESGPASRQARDRARDHAFEAAQLAAQTSDPHWEVKLLLRASDVLDRCGDHDDAVQMQQRALVLMGLHNPELLGDNVRVVGGPQDPLQMTAHGTLM